MSSEAVRCHGTVCGLKHVWLEDKTVCAPGVAEEIGRQLGAWVAMRALNLPAVSSISLADNTCRVTLPSAGMALMHKGHSALRSVYKVKGCKQQPRHQTLLTSK